jgi:N-acetylglucosamine-6-phosphate deacetylase
VDPVQRPAHLDDAPAAAVITARILGPEGFAPARVTYGRRILAVDSVPEAPAGRFLLPGFIDLHVHGGGGGDVMDGEAAIRVMARCHAARGTTALLATTVCAPAAELVEVAAAVGRVAAARRPGEARVLGLHLEGPFINPARLGAQPPFAIPPDTRLVAAIARAAPLRVATYAPELDAEGALLATFLGLGVRAQLGHSDAPAAIAERALAAGAAGVTHLFNAMSGLDHRAPGVAAAALAHAAAAEIIPDGIHVAPAMVLAARRAIPGLYAVTDATAAAGMPDGPYRLGRRTVVKAHGAVRLADGTLAGSALTMDRALARLLALGLPLAEAALRLSTLPARHLGLADRGTITPGAVADLVLVDGTGRLLAVVVEGEPIVTVAPDGAAA